jgi:hypothetical protein
MVGRVNQVLDEYEDQLPLTCRQIYYRMIAEWRYPKGEPFERKLYAALDHARRARMIPFAHIRDDGILGGGWWPVRPDQQIKGWELEAGNFQRDRQEGQPVRIQVWCEAAGMVPQLTRVADQFSVPVYSSGGFNSLTAIRQIVDSCIWDTEGPTVLLHLGDCDPSGHSIYQAMYEDVAAFLERDRRSPRQTFAAERVAITFDQIAEYGLVADEIKTNDSRSQVWRRRGLTKKVELEALAPNVIAQLLTAAIEHYLDPAPWRDVLNKEVDDRKKLRKAAESARLTLGYCRAAERQQSDEVDDG